MAAVLSRGKAAAPHIASSIRHAQAPQLHCNSTPSFNSLTHTHSGHTAAQNALIAQAPQHLAAAQQTSCTWDIHSSPAHHHHGRADSDRASMKLPLTLHDLEWFHKASLQLRTHNQKSHITTHHSSTTSLQKAAPRVCRKQHHEFAESPERQCSRRFATAARTIALADHIRHSHHVITAALSAISLHKNKHSRATRLSCTTHAQPTMGARQTEVRAAPGKRSSHVQAQTNDATSNQQEVSLLGAHCNQRLSIRNGEKSAEHPTQSRVEPRPSSNISHYAHKLIAHNHNMLHAEQIRSQSLNLNPHLSLDLYCRLAVDDITLDDSSSTDKLTLGGAL
jgi:hypothetical protein